MEALIVVFIAIAVLYAWRGVRRFVAWWQWTRYRWEHRTNDY